MNETYVVMDVQAAFGFKYCPEIPQQFSAILQTISFTYSVHVIAFIGPSFRAFSAAPALTHLKPYSPPECQTNSLSRVLFIVFMEFDYNCIIQLNSDLHNQTRLKGVLSTSVNCKAISHTSSALRRSPIQVQM